MNEPYRFIRQVLPGHNGADRCGVCGDALTNSRRAYLYAAGPDVRLVTHPLCGPGGDPHATYCPICLRRMNRRRSWDSLHNRWDSTSMACLVCDRPESA